jgi:hypothetical protein
MPLFILPNYPGTREYLPSVVLSGTIVVRRSIVYLWRDSGDLGDLYTGVV